MIVATCDLCGAQCGASELATLMPQYQINCVRDVCPACRKWADKAKGDLLLEIAPKLRQQIADRKGVAQAQPARWWRRFVGA